MSYFLGNIEYFGMALRVCIVARDLEQASKLQNDRVQEIRDARRMEGDPFAHDCVGCGELIEIEPAAFVEMRPFLEVLGLEPEFQDMPVPERVRLLATRIGRQLAQHDSKVPHGRLLHAVAASLGETDWQVLTHRQCSRASAPQPGTLPEVAAQEQTEIPGVGFLYEVPVTIDVTMTAVVLARGETREDAIEEACRFAHDGKAKFELDEGNYRKLGDHYCPDDGAARRVDESLGPCQAEDLERGAMCGPYSVELCVLLPDDDEDFLWADLRVFGKTDAQAGEDGALSCCPRTASTEDQRAFCRRVAEVLQHAAPDPSKVEWNALTQAFYRAVQGDQSQDALATAERELRESVADGEQPLRQGVLREFIASVTLRRGGTQTVTVEAQDCDDARTRLLALGYASASNVTAN